MDYLATELHRLVRGLRGLSHSEGRHDPVDVRVDDVRELAAAALRSGAGGRRPGGSLLVALDAPGGDQPRMTPIEPAGTDYRLSPNFKDDPMSDPAAIADALNKAQALGPTLDKYTALLSQGVAF